MPRSPDVTRDHSQDHRACARDEAGRVRNRKSITRVGWPNERRFRMFLIEFCFREMMAAKPGLSWNVVKRVEDLKGITNCLTRGE